jgi:hypothetical protein
MNAGQVCNLTGGGLSDALADEEVSSRVQQPFAGKKDVPW